jgi:hypothetical protein
MSKYDYDDEVVSGESLFDKGESENLNLKSFKKLKAKKRIHVVSDTLEFLVQWYFNHDKSEQKFVKNALSTVGSMEYLEALAAVTTPKKKKDAIKIPEGLSVILLDAKYHIRKNYQKQISKEANNGSNKEYLKSMEEYLIRTINLIDGLIARITKKGKKILKSMGLEDEFASYLAGYLVPAKYLNVENVGKYAHMFNDAMIQLYRRGINDNNGKLINEVGVKLDDTESILALYEEFFRGVDKKVYLAGLTGILLEYRQNINHKPAQILNSKITDTLLDVLEGNEYINYTGKKNAKKKSLKISDKELNKVIKQFVKKTKNDRDVLRRVNFNSISPDDYQRILKVYGKHKDIILSERFEMPEPHPQQNNNSDNRKPNNNQKNNNKKN